MAAEIFLIDQTDCSKNVLADGSYTVNREDVYEEWKDANEKTRREITRAGGKVVGSFDMYFPTLKDYEDFLDVLAAHKQADTTYLMTLKLNNEKAPATFYGYMKFAPSRKRTDAWKDHITRFTVQIEEA